MAKDTCLKCGKPLPANKELASVPNARLVAFDPDANRVWRICIKCHHWNLLGPEASAAAMPELVARFAMLPSAGPEGLAKAKASNKLDLFRVGGTQERAAAMLELSEVRRELLGPVPLLVKVFLLLYTPYLLYTVASDPTWKAWSGAALCFGIMGLVTHITRARLAERSVDRQIAWPIAGVLVGITTTVVGFLHYGWALLAIALGTLFGWVGRRDLLRERAVTWTPGQADLSFEDENPNDVGHLLTIQLTTPRPITAEQIEAAFDRLDRLGSLAGVLRHLTVDRGLPEGRLELNTMTLADLALLSLASRAASVEPAPPVLAGLPDAKMIAEVAETLDRPTGAS